MKLDYQTIVTDTQSTAPLFNALKLVQLISELLLAKKAQDILVLDLKKHPVLCDYFILASGTSGRHLAALADYIAFELKKLSIHAAVEGAKGSEWVLIDAGDVVVHLFRPETRAFYDLEKMWSLESC